MTKKKLNISIDGRKFEFLPGQTILEIANNNDIFIPTLCYIKNLPPLGNCRLCIVKVEGMKGFPTACSTPATENMIITTKDEEG